MGNQGGRRPGLREQRARLAALRGSRVPLILSRAPPCYPAEQFAPMPVSKTAFTGIVRGSIKPQLLRFNGPWVRVAELLDVFNEHTKCRWGVHEIVALVKQDNKQRFIIAGSEDDPRSSCYNQPVFPYVGPCCSWPQRQAAA